MWERYASDVGDLNEPHAGYRHSYPFSIMVNADGKRFLDEGADFRNYTYAKYGRIVLQQPGSFAWQVFDSQVTHLLRDEYKARKSVVSGKSVSVRVDLGGRRHIKKTNTKLTSNKI